MEKKLLSVLTSAVLSVLILPGCTMFEPSNAYKMRAGMQTEWDVPEAEVVYDVPPAHTIAIQPGYPVPDNTGDEVPESEAEPVDYVPEPSAIPPPQIFTETTELAPLDVVEIPAVMEEPLDDGSESLPPDAKPGECYARVNIPPRYETVTEQVLLQPESEEIVVIPAQYEWVEEEVMVKEASTELEVVPAEYEWVEEEVLITPASVRTEEVPARYEWIEEEVMVKPARREWKKGTGLITSVDNATGEIMCLVELPPVYEKVKKRVLVEPASMKEIQIPAEYETIRKRVMTKPSTTREVTVPAEYDKVKVQKMISAEREERKVIPAVYQTVTKEVMVEKGRMLWKRVLCESNLSQDVVRQIQTALIEQGYNAGGVDGMVGDQTKEAIKIFQTDKGLATGGLTYETLNALGITLE